MTCLLWYGNSPQIISTGLRRWCFCQVKVTDNPSESNPDFPFGEKHPLEAGSSSPSEALSTEVKEESAEVPNEKNEVEPRSNGAEETTEVEPTDNHVEEKTGNTNQTEVKVDQDEDKVMTFCGRIRTLP